MVTLARAYALSPVAQALGVHYAALERHLVARPAPEPSRAGALPPGFVEVPVAAWPSGPEWVIEPEDRRGLKLSRRRLSAKLCQAWNWVQPNGQLRDMVARSLMLELHRAGHIKLPAKRMSPPNNAARHRAPERELALAAGPQQCSLAELGPLEIRQQRLICPPSPRVGSRGPPRRPGKAARLQVFAATHACRSNTLI
jgi:hypothetical protein